MFRITNYAIWTKFINNSCRIHSKFIPNNADSRYSTTKPHPTPKQQNHLNNILIELHTKCEMLMLGNGWKELKGKNCWRTLKKFIEVEQNK